ncbi:hypothetical protein QUB78_34485 [Microcoleus sp. ARI1-A4]
MRQTKPKPQHARHTPNRASASATLCMHTTLPSPPEACLTEYWAFSRVKAVLQDLYKMEPAGAG